MDITHCSFADAHGLNDLMKNYRNQDDSIQEFYHFSPDHEGVKKAIEERSNYPVRREVLVKALEHQNADFLSSFPKVEKNITLLHQDNTFTVTTGHQLSLAGGPAFFFYKILNVIALTQELNAKHDAFNFVPVFWMATEDHDFEEISKATFFGQNFQWEASYEGPVGRISPDPAQTIIEEIAATFGSQEVDTFCAQVLKEAYAKKTLSEAIRYLVYQVLGSYGVVILDGDDVSLKQEMISTFEKEIFNQTLSKAWQGQSETLSEKGFDQQLHIRDINIFYIQDDYRVRIKKVDQNFQTIDGKFEWSRGEMEKELQDHPENFSPNAALRPVYQEKILPNIAYVGGPGEISYWLQLKKGFEASNIFYPAVLLRNSVYFLDGGDQKKMSKYDLNFSDFFIDIHALEKRLAKAFSDVEPDLQNEIQVILSQLEGIKEKADKIDGSLVGKVEGMAANIENMVSGLEKRLVKAQKQNNETMINQLHAVRDKILPNDTPQERVESFLSYFVKNGGHQVIELLLKELSVLDREVLVVK